MVNAHLGFNAENVPQFTAFFKFFTIFNRRIISVHITYMQWEPFSPHSIYKPFKGSVITAARFVHMYGKTLIGNFLCIANQAQLIRLNNCRVYAFHFENLIKSKPFKTIISSVRSIIANMIQCFFSEFIIRFANSDNFIIVRKGTHCINMIPRMVMCCSYLNNP